MDGFEANDTAATARYLGTIPDTSSYPYSTLTPSLHPDGDVDWFRFTDSDDAGVLAPRADLSGIPAGRDYDLCVYYQCLSAETANVECDAGTPAQNGGRNGCCSRNAGDASESVRFTVVCGASSLDDDSGDVFVAVEPYSGAATCSPYSLSLGDD